MNCPRLKTLKKEEENEEEKCNANVMMVVSTQNSNNNTDAAIFTCIDRRTTTPHYLQGRKWCGRLAKNNKIKKESERESCKQRMETPLRNWTELIYATHQSAKRAHQQCLICICNCLLNGMSLKVCVWVSVLWHIHPTIHPSIHPSACCEWWFICNRFGARVCVLFCTKPKSWTGTQLGFKVDKVLLLV